MYYRTIRAVLSAAFMLLPVAASATDLIPVRDFARHGQLAYPRLSPDGKHVAVRWDNGDSHALLVYSVDDMSRPLSMLRMPKYEVPADIVWTSNTRLIVEKGREYGSLDKASATGEIIATDLDGKHQDYLYGYNAKAGRRAATRGTDRGWGFYNGRPRPADGTFYMLAQSWDSQNHNLLYRVNADHNTRELIGDIDVAGMDFMVGADKTAHFAFGRNNKYQYVVYRRLGSRWVALSADKVGGSFTPLDYAPDHQRIYASYNRGTGPEALVEMDEDGGNRTTLASDPFSSIGGIQWTALPERPFATSPATGIPKVSYIDPNLPAAKLHMALSKSFPGEYVDFINYSEDGGQLLFTVTSDRDPGSVYLIDTHTFKVRKLFAFEPWIDPSKMAERRPLHFKASDGREIEVILTLPPGRGESNLPMVLVPHGGPIGVQDDWGYDTSAQFLASRGYLVLQVNYIGSSGRGIGFRDAGNMNWATGIQQELIDSVKWAIAQKYADADRVCIFGGSFGGYSALMAPIRAPGMFKCAVGYAGVYDLELMYKKGDVYQSEQGRNALREELGDDPVQLAAISPTHLADKITVPVFLIHGEDDRRAPFAHAKEMRDALEAAHKTFEWMSKPGEGHGFYDEDNNVELYTRLQAFLEKYIGPGAPIQTRS